MTADDGSCSSDGAKRTAYTDKGATSFLVASEVPLFGTALLGASVLGVFAFYETARRRSRISVLA